MYVLSFRSSETSTSDRRGYPPAASNYLPRPIATDRERPLFVCCGKLMGGADNLHARYPFIHAACKQVSTDESQTVCDTYTSLLLMLLLCRDSIMSAGQLLTCWIGEEDAEAAPSKRTARSRTHLKPVLTMLATQCSSHGNLMLKSL